MVKRAAFFVFCLVMAAPKLWAADMAVSDVWARASVGGAGVGAVFLTINNASDQGDKLLSVSTPASKRAELHTHSEVNGVMAMRKVDAIDVAGGQKIELKPGGLHIMLLGLTAPLKDGDSFPVALTFEKAGTVTVSASVGGVAAMGGRHMDDHHMGDGHH